MDLTTLTDDDIDALRISVLTEQERRDTLANAPPKPKRSPSPTPRRPAARTATHGPSPRAPTTPTPRVSPSRMAARRGSR